jgi:predicted AlkP superfamily phosphohydrolase/phosphomutase
MAKRAPAKRCFLIGLDGVGLEQMLHMVRERHCPNVKRLLERGVYRER